MFGECEAFSSFAVDDLDRARTFYATTLGLAVDANDMGLTVRLRDGGRIFIYPKPEHVPASFTVLNFRVGDIDTAMDELTARGVRFEHYDTNGIQTDARGVHAYEGMRIAWFRDPAGNVLSIIQED